jgi:sugar lactone lactonase YvrE
MPNGITVAGGNGNGNKLNQLSYPKGVFIDDDQTIYVADTQNYRIVEWKRNAKTGRIIAGGNGQLNGPRNVIIDKKNDSLIICDRENSRVVRWSFQNLEIEDIISNIDCSDLIMDNDGYLYVSDIGKHEVRRWKIGDKDGIKVAGGNNRGNGLNQLSYPYYIFIDQDHAVYISDYNNHRVMKWTKNAEKGSIVAGGHGPGNDLRQLSSPYGIVVDQLGTLYVADSDNHRVMRWLKGATEGSVVVGGNGKGDQPNLLNSPIDLSFDRQNNLYVVDSENHRIQKFDKI